MKQDVLSAEEAAALAAWWKQAFDASGASPTYEPPQTSRPHRDSH